MRKKVLAGVVMCLTMVCAQGVSFGAVANDEITSAKVREATAGSTSQDTNSGNGIKTGHIVDTAVTTAKIANGAVTDAKITGPISVGKLPVGSTSTTVAAGNHTHDASYSKKYANVVVVAKSGGDYTNPVTAVNSITNASAINPYLVKVMPGLYDLGSATLQMKPYVNLEGSGSDNTIITSANSNVDDPTCTVGTIMMANNTTLKNLKVINTAVDAGNSNRVVGVGFNNVMAIAESISVLVGSDTTYSQTAGICSYGVAGNAVLNNVTAEARCGTGPDTGHTAALYLSVDGSATVTNSKFSAFGSDNAHTHVVDCTNGNTMTGVLNISDSYVEGTLINQIAGGNGNRGIDAGNCLANVTNTIVKLSGARPESDDRGIGFGFQGGKVIGSQVYSSNVAVDFNGLDPTSLAMVATSLLKGTIISNPINSKLIYNFDENGNPIPNQ